MNKFFCSLIIVLLALPSFAQKEGVSSKHRPGFLWYFSGITTPKPEKLRKYDRLLFEVVYNDWQGKNTKPFQVAPVSIGFNGSLMFDIPLNEKNTFSLGLGITYGIFRLRMDDFILRNDSLQASIVTPGVVGLGIDRSIFKFHSLSLPVELRFRGAKWQHTKFHLGARVGFQFAPTTVLSSKQNGINYLQKTRGLYDFNQLGIQTYLRFGIRNWSIYGAYHVLPFFKNAASTKLNGFQLGVSLALF